MSYQNYVIAAYMVFVVVLLWDFVAPRIRIAQSLRALRVAALRREAAQSTATARSSLASTELER